MFLCHNLNALPTNYSLIHNMIIYHNFQAPLHKRFSIARYFFSKQIFALILCVAIQLHLFVLHVSYQTDFLTPVLSQNSYKKTGNILRAEEFCCFRSVIIPTIFLCILATGLESTPLWIAMVRSLIGFSASTCTSQRTMT